ncbi:glucosyl transferase family 2 [Actibacterium mucosum KCTC 23349]|uniref:Glucans biosynthesis glucosyltransferase H n=1 Tax=Actibacterium mucosum KCTC 23349 TaxID=1454373 RepID=A0A037ZKZ9_9RHOB|nr:glucans biosynthesis glucosyltransferase MdoH [Actibacterium mucosum]KAJ56222.1 glucosyl transferase family 2 [Actibacterium mucosum KCTC 23349]
MPRDLRDPLALMPPHAPLEMPPQDLRAAPPLAVRAPAPSNRTRFWRLVVFGLAGLAMTALLAAIGNWLAMGGLMALEVMLLALIGLTGIWILISVSTALAGLHALAVPPRVARHDNVHRRMSTAILVPVYNETPREVFGNAAAMLQDLMRADPQGDYRFYILSDTQDEEATQAEAEGFAWLYARAPAAIPVHYRRRVPNIDRKVGNIADWVTQWGGAHEAMLVLDADSLMSGQAISSLVQELAADPGAGLIQSCPRLIGAESLFAQLQQFANAAYGFLLAEGLARWSGREGNYWGHNAIMRTRAFAGAAGLPHLRGRRGRDQMIWSHDFVEAALLRRAGWGVRFLTRPGGSYEETPATLIDHVLRDRRWCQGNLQHLRLLATRGLHPLSRYHLFHGAMAYLLSPAWFVLLVIWALLGTGQETSVIRYFSETNPLYPVWPELTRTQSVLFLAVMYGMLLAPKILGITVILTSRTRRRAFGGMRRFLPAALIELAMSIAYAPVQMVQQTVAVLRIALGLRVGWTPQNRSGGQYGLLTTAKFHALETVTGLALLAGIAFGIVSLWLLPIGLSLAIAVPLSAISGLNAMGRRGALIPAPEHIDPPAIRKAAEAERAMFGDTARPELAAE